VNPGEPGIPSKPFSTQPDLVDSWVEQLGCQSGAFSRSYLPRWPSQTASGTAAAARESRGALVVTFDIPVDPGAADYVHRAAQAAIASNQDLVIVMNTPGGLLDSMAEIVGDGGPIADVQSHGLSVYTYVPPVGFAASAGSYIALATNAIYMGNGSVIGPSTPYIIGGDPSQIPARPGISRTGSFDPSPEERVQRESGPSTWRRTTRLTRRWKAASVGLITGLVDTYAGSSRRSGCPTRQLRTFRSLCTDRFLSFLSDPTVDGLFILVGIIALVLDLFHRTLFLRSWRSSSSRSDSWRADHRRVRRRHPDPDHRRGPRDPGGEAGHGFFAITGIALGSRHLPPRVQRPVLAVSLRRGAST